MFFKQMQQKLAMALFDLVASQFVPLRAVRLGETASGPRAWTGGGGGSFWFPVDFFVRLNFKDIPFFRHDMCMY